MREQQLGVQPRGRREGETRGGVAESVAGGGHAGMRGVNVANVETVAGCLNVRDWGCGLVLWTVESGPFRL
ncbi:hypothetical protein SPHINGO8AM_20014 [Sphingomonas sp. 8AM]|nr:hypothetical protein SPHINGO8AM_20014 [Sphingomonas sp. 8AM]